jgi:hypothetical protein
MLISKNIRKIQNFFTKNLDPEFRIRILSEFSDTCFFSRKNFAERTEVLR